MTHSVSTWTILVMATLIVACSSDAASTTTTGTSSASASCTVSFANDAKVGKVMCACGNVGPSATVETEAIDACTPEALGRPALCLDHSAQGFCDCRAYICRTRVKDGRCECSVGAHTSSETNEYTDGCTSTKGVCCIEGVSCQCGLDKCGSGRTLVASCDASVVLDEIAPKLAVAGAKRVPTCSP